MPRMRSTRRSRKCVWRSRSVPPGMQRTMTPTQSESWTNDNTFKTAVLQLLLGGGGSFSAGGAVSPIVSCADTVAGPGKGMYSRFYRNVLAQHYEIETAVATNTVYSDAGLFVLQGASTPEFVRRTLDAHGADAVQAKEMIKVLLKQVHGLACV